MLSCKSNIDRYFASEFCKQPRHQEETLRNQRALWKQRIARQQRIVRKERTPRNQRKTRKRRNTPKRKTGGNRITFETEWGDAQRPVRPQTRLLSRQTLLFSAQRVRCFDGPLQRLSRMQEEVWFMRLTQRWRYRNVWEIVTKSWRTGSCWLQYSQLLSVVFLNTCVLLTKFYRVVSKICIEFV